MKLYILRHGETAWNKERKLQGKSDVELNEKGRELARRTAEGMKNIPFDVVFTSPLKRAKETAELVLGQRTLPFIEDRRIAEISFGEYEGTAWGMGISGYQYENISNFFNAPEKYVADREAESLESLLERTADFMRDITTRPELEEKTILVSTHGAATRGLLNSLKKYPIEEFWQGGVAPNCGISIVESHQGKPVLLEENKIFYQ